MTSQRQIEVSNRREIMFRIIETIKLIGKNSLSYRRIGNSKDAYNLLTGLLIKVIF
jgi:hypothetical protein